MGTQNKLGKLAACCVLVLGTGAALAQETDTVRQEVRTLPELLEHAPPDNGSQPSCKNPRKYIELLNAERYSEISSLYAENAVHYGPDGFTRRGRKALHDFYLKPFHKNHTVYVTSAMQDGRNCILTLAAGAPGSAVALRGVDLFKVNEQGEIESFIVFVSPTPTLPKDDLDLDKFLKDREKK